LHTDYGNY